jgi:hypothetical protein
MNVSSNTIPSVARHRQHGADLQPDDASYAGLNAA